MATSSSSLQNKMQNLRNRLQEENEARERDRLASLDIGGDGGCPPGGGGGGGCPGGIGGGGPSPPYHTGNKPRPLPTLGNFVGPGRPDGLPGRKIRPGNLPVNFSPQMRNQEANEIEAKLQEIMKLTGVLNMDGKRYHTDIKDLEHMGELGTGTCGHVVKMLHQQSGKVIAVKQMRRSGNREENKRIIMDLEVVLKSHDCPYIVQCLGCFITDCDVWICMELMATCMDKLLKRLNQPIPEDILGKLAVATVKALHYLKESHGVIHRDVKPSNILLDEKGIVKLCDFGISGRLVDSKAKTRTAGCAAYMAPERIDPPDPTRPDYDIRADVWSLGITLVELATGQFPYKDCKTDFEVLTKVLQDDPPCLPPNRDFSPEFCTFVKDCLTKNYKQRPKYKKLLEHCFIKKYESKPVDVAAWFRRVMQQLEDNVRNSPQRRFTPPPGSPLPPPRRRSSENHHRSLSETFRGLSTPSPQPILPPPSTSPAPAAAHTFTPTPLYLTTPRPYQNGDPLPAIPPRPAAPQLFSRFPPDGLRWKSPAHQRTGSLDSNSNESLMTTPPTPRRANYEYQHHPHYHHHHYHFSHMTPQPSGYIKAVQTVPVGYYRVAGATDSAGAAGVVGADGGYPVPIHRLNFGGSPVPFRRTDHSPNRRGFAEGSPLTFRRYVGPPPPQPPPRRFSESSSVPGSPLLQRCNPEYLRPRAQFTPEPQRRSYMHHHYHQNSDL